MPTFKPTQQQQEAIDAFSTGEGVGISAGAGCGKTATLQMMAQSTRNRGLLLCFNRAVADEASQKLRGTNTDAKNTHRIAYAWAMGNTQGRTVLDKIKSTSRVRRDQTARSLGILPWRDGDKEVTLPAMTELTIETLNNFMRSDSDDITEEHLAYVKGIEEPGVYGKGKVHDAVAEQVLTYSQKMWDAAVNTPSMDVRVSHDTYLKLWALSKPQLPYSHILLDECQDTNGAVYGVFNSQDAQKIFVGDANQQLFAWNGSLNIMDRLDAPHKVHLTQSWRFGKAIEDSANTFLNMLDADIRLQGNPRIASRVTPGAAFDPHKTSAVLTRTNAGAVKELIEAQNAHQSAYLIGGAQEVIRLIQEAEKLRQGRTSNHPDLIGFPSWGSLKTYVNEDPDASDLKLIVNLIEKFGANTIVANLNRTTAREEDAQTVISTIHKVKGREWDQVRLSSDFDNMIDRAAARLVMMQKARKSTRTRGFTREELMIAYVAVTRAKEVLDPGGFQAQLASIIQDSPNLVSETSGVSLPESAQGLTFSLPTEIEDVLRSMRNVDERDTLVAQILREGLRSRGFINPINEVPF